MLESRITSKGQTTIPRQVRDALGLRPGDTVRYFLDRSGGVRVLRVKSLDEVAGCLAKYYNGPPVPVEEMQAAVDEALEEKFKHLGPKRSDTAAE